VLTGGRAGQGEPDNRIRTVPTMNDAAHQSEPLPVWVVVADAAGQLTVPCQAVGITAHRVLLVAATDDVDVFVAAAERFGVTVPPRRRGDLLPAGVVQAVSEPIVGTARERPSRLLARCGDGRDGAVLVDGDLVVPWVDLGDLTALATEVARTAA